MSEADDAREADDLAELEEARAALVRVLGRYWTDHGAAARRGPSAGDDGEPLE